MEDAKRRILIRVIGAPILVAIFALLLYSDYKTRFYPSVISLLILSLTIFCLNEFYTLCELKGYKPERKAGIICGILSIWPLIFYVVHIPIGLWDSKLADLLENSLLVFSSVLLIYVMCKLINKVGEFTIVDAGLTILGYLYVSMLSRVLYIYDEWWSPNLTRDIINAILYLVLVVKSSDIVAYCIGKTLGKRKLASAISPNKTWEGAVAGFLAGTIAGALFLQFSGERLLKYGYKDMPSLLQFTIISALVTIAAQMGDLVESAFKRWAGVKDSGNFIPEFGGVLDMVDGFLLAIPVYQICKSIFF